MEFKLVLQYSTVPPSIWSSHLSLSPWRGRYDRAECMALVQALWRHAHGGAEREEGRVGGGEGEDTADQQDQVGQQAGDAEVLQAVAAADAAEAAEAQAVADAQAAAEAQAAAAAAATAAAAAVPPPPSSLPAGSALLRALRWGAASPALSTGSSSAAAEAAGAAVASAAAARPAAAAQPPAAASEGPTKPCSVCGVHPAAWLVVNPCRHMGPCKCCLPPSGDSTMLHRPREYPVCLRCDGPVVQLFRVHI